MSLSDDIAAARSEVIETFGEPVILQPDGDPVRQVTVAAVYHAPAVLERGGALDAPLTDRDYRVVVETDQLPVLVPGDIAIVRDRSFALVSATDDAYGCTTLILRPV